MQIPPLSWTLVAVGGAAAWRWGLLQSCLRTLEYLVGLVIFLEPASHPPPAGTRHLRWMRKLMDLGFGFAAAPVAMIEDVRSPGGIKVRFYYPSTGKDLPCLVWYHGGGWVVGSVRAAEKHCQQLAHGAGVIVASVEYRLAPEHRFPAAHEDCLEATEWIWKERARFNIDVSKPLAVGGDSAGGNMALSTALAAESSTQIGAVVAVYPVVTCQGIFPSQYEFLDRLPLSWRGMMWFYRHYAPEQSQQEDWRLRLLQADAARLKRLPLTHVLVARQDPLRDEALAMVDRLRELKVEVRSKTFEQLAHGDFGLMHARGQEAMAWAVESLRASFA